MNKVLLVILGILISTLCYADRHEIMVLPPSALGVSGGGADTVTTDMIEISTLPSRIGFFLYGTASDDLDVTYEMGYRQDTNKKVTESGAITWVDGAANIVTAADVTVTNTSYTEWDPPDNLIYVRFTVDNEDASHTDTVSIYIQYKDKE